MKKVSVIIPTYNRLHTLKLVMESYLNQGPAGEIIFMADGCTDGTVNFLNSMRKGETKVVTIENTRRRGSQFSKNAGINAAAFEYIFIGEDDVYLEEGHIEKLLHTLENENADIAGGRVLYMSNNENYEDTLARYNRINKYPIDFETLEIRFGNSYKKIIEVPFLQSIALIRKEVFSKVRYDTGFTGSAFREETDFYLRCRKEGTRIIWSPFVTAYNLPPYICKNSGSRRVNPLIYEISAIINNYKFLLRHYDYLKKEYSINNTLHKQQLIFTADRISKLAKSLKIKLGIRF